MTTAVHDIFRSGGTRQTSPVRTPSPPSHRAIFRRPKQTYSPSENSGSSEESIMAVLPHGPSWPPITIPESESADASKLGLSRPIQTGSSVSRHNMDLNASTSSEREHRRKPTYYKIQMRNGMAKLASGDDSSVIITDDHNDRILLAPIQERKQHLIRANPITEASSSSSGSPGRRGGHQQTWEVLENGKIVVTNPGTPSSLSSTKQFRIATHTPKAPRKPFLRIKRTPAAPKKGHESNDAESPPRLQKSSFDTSSTDASSSDNSFYNEMLDFAEPTSPPRMDRMTCPSQVLFAEGSKESGDHSSSKWSSKSKGSSRSESGKKKEEECSNSSFISQLFDLISFGPCCQMDSICRDSQLISCGRLNTAKVG
jgi:hypothetical protein